MNWGIRASIEEVFAKHNLSRVLERTKRFYDAMFTGARKSVSHAVVKMLNARIKRLRALTIAAPDRGEESNPEMNTLLDAIERRDGCFYVVTEPGAKAPRPQVIPVRFGKAWSKDQRQQFGRLYHTFTVASLVGVVGYFRSTTNWGLSAVLNEAMLFVVAVVAFWASMDSMNGNGG